MILVLVDAISSYVLTPYHPVRNTLDKLVNPMLAPIRKIVPIIGVFDLSPLILIILIQIITSLILAFLRLL